MRSQSRIVPVIVACAVERCRERTESREYTTLGHPGVALFNRRLHPRWPPRRAMNRTGMHSMRLRVQEGRYDVRQRHSPACTHCQRTPEAAQSQEVGRHSRATRTARSCRIRPTDRGTRPGKVNCHPSQRLLPYPSPLADRCAQPMYRPRRAARERIRRSIRLCARSPHTIRPDNQARYRFDPTRNPCSAPPHPTRSRPHPLLQQATRR
jgi:hypothetical protein